MTSGPTTNNDPRMIAAGLAANAATTQPAIITATGRAAPSQIAYPTTGGWAPLALLPHVDYVDNPNLRPGCGFVGGRHSSISPLLAPGAIPAFAHMAVQLRSLPTSGEEILRELRQRAGLWSAPGALFARVAWPDTFVATWLDRLRANDYEAKLIVAHAQGSLALRKMWFGVEWNVGVAAGADLAVTVGAGAVGRALIDTVTLIDRLAAPARDGDARSFEREAALGALLTALGHFVRHVRAAEQASDPAVVRRKLRCATDWARTIFDAIGVFAVAEEAPRKRWDRLTSMLQVGKSIEHAGSAENKLERLSRSLEQLRCARIGRRFEGVGWRLHVRRALLRLASPDRQVRINWLERFRCDLFYKLAITRRLDRLYRLFPWAAAPHGAFPDCAGGALGALASLYEAGRAVDIGRDMKRRLSDEGDRPGMVARLTPRQAGMVYANPCHVVRATGRNYAAGAALVAQVTSHVMVSAAMRGKYVGDNLSLECLRDGNLGYNDAAAFRVEHTRDAVIAIQQAQPAFEINSTDDDLIRHMGLTLVAHLGAAAHSIWPTRSQRTGLVIARLTVHNGKRPKREEGAWPTGPWSALSKSGVHQQLVRSMLHTVDGGVSKDDTFRDPIKALKAPATGGGEFDRAVELQEKPSRKTGAWAERSVGQSAARQANHALPERGAALRDLVDDARRWRPFDSKNPQPAPNDDLLEDILLGRASLAQLTPVSDLFEPILWFAPLIDRDRLRWIARGMPGQQRGDDHAPRAARLKSWLEGVRQWSWAPFAGPIVRGRDDVIACHLFTGVSSITADLAHVTAAAHANDGTQGAEEQRSRKMRKARRIPASFEWQRASGLGRRHRRKFKARDLAKEI